MNNGDEQDSIEYNSKNIKKKNLKFNVQPKKSTSATSFFNKIGQWFKNLGQSLKNFWKKLTTLLFKGKNKFITIGIVGVVVIATVTLSIVLPQLTTSSEPTPEEVADERKALQKEVTDVLNSIDYTTTDETKDAILSDLDAKIEDVTAEEDRIFLLRAKASVYFHTSDYPVAINMLESLVGEIRALEDWETLVQVYESLAVYNELTSMPEVAIKWLEAAISAIDEAGTHPEDDTDKIAGRAFYTSKINELKQEIAQ